MPISTRILGTAKGDKSGTSFPVAISATTAAEYVQVLVCYSYAAGFVGGCTGYGLVADDTSIRSSFMPYHQLFAKTAAAGETSITITKGSAVANYAIIVLGHTGADTIDPYSAAPTFAEGGQASGTSPSVTPAAAGTVFWTLGHQNYRAAADSNITWTAGGELSEVVDVFNLASMASAAATPGSASGTRAWSISPWGGNTASAVMTFALREAVVAVGPEPGRALLAA